MTDTILKLRTDYSAPLTVIERHQERYEKMEKEQEEQLESAPLPKGWLFFPAIYKAEMEEWLPGYTCQKPVKFLSRRDREGGMTKHHRNTIGIDLFYAYPNLRDMFWETHNVLGVISSFLIYPKDYKYTVTFSPNYYQCERSEAFLSKEYLKKNFFLNKWDYWFQNYKFKFYDVDTDRNTLKIVPGKFWVAKRLESTPELELLIKEDYEANQFEESLDSCFRAAYLFCVQTDTGIVAHYVFLYDCRIHPSDPAPSYGEISIKHDYGYTHEKMTMDYLKRYNMIDFRAHEQRTQSIIEPRHSEDSTESARKKPRV